MASLAIMLWPRSGMRLQTKASDIFPSRTACDYHKVAGFSRASIFCKTFFHQAPPKVKTFFRQDVFHTRPFCWKKHTLISFDMLKFEMWHVF